MGEKKVRRARLKITGIHTRITQAPVIFPWVSCEVAHIDKRCLVGTCRSYDTASTLGGRRYGTSCNIAGKIRLNLTYPCGATLNTTGITAASIAPWLPDFGALITRIWNGASWWLCHAARLDKSTTTLSDDGKLLKSRALDGCQPYALLPSWSSLKLNDLHWTLETLTHWQQHHYLHLVTSPRSHNLH